MFKEHGVLSVPSRLGKSDRRRVLGIELQQLLDCKIFPVHRLDFEVAGLMLFAKNSESHKILSQCFESHEKITKKYWALCLKSKDQNLGNEKLELENQILEPLIAQGKKRAFFAPYGKKSTTILCLKKEIPYFKEFTQNHSDDFEYFEVSPLTGRRHQIRLVLSSIGYPIIGDSLYGSNIPYKQNGIALIAHSIKFHDPKTIDFLALDWTEIKL